MTSIDYNVVFSRLFSRIQAYNFATMSKEQLVDFLNEWLHSAASKPHVRRLFSSFSMDDEIKQLVYEMKYPLDEESDRDFVIEILSIGTAIQWLEPQIKSITHISQLFASKEEKFYSQSAHLSELRSLCTDFQTEQRRLIADRSALLNVYIGDDNNEG